MSAPLNDQMEAALQELRESQAKIKKVSADLENASITEVSKDHMVEATCDAQGRLSGLKLNGKSYRTMPPAELCAKLLETIHAAQAKAQAKAAESFTEMIGGDSLGGGLGGLLGGLTGGGLGGGIGDLFGSGPEGFDLDKMIEQAIQISEGPMLPDERPEDVPKRAKRDD